MADKQLTLGSLFDGSGGFPLGGILAGITPLWASEIEPFPIRVTTKRLPGMRHIGDVNDVRGGGIAPVDIITFGSPCQDLSVSGKRRGLEGERSGLFHQAVRIIKEMREATNGRYPRYAVWENVPGAFSSNRGEDFRCVLQELCGISQNGVHIPLPPKGKWPCAGEIVGENFSLAWRVLDAQYWGVPQRRRRIYLVLDTGGHSAGAVLFESEGVPRDPPEGGFPWERAASCSEGGASEAGIGSLKVQAAGFCTEHSADSRGIGYQEETSPTLRAGAVPAVFENHAQEARYSGPLSVAPTMAARYGTGGNNTPVIVDCPALVMTAGSFTQICEEASPTLLARDYKDPPVVGVPAYGISLDADASFREEIQPPAVAEGPGFVAAPVYCLHKAEYFTAPAEGVSNTLVATDYKDPPAVCAKKDMQYVVRRLTPAECGRLQGFPDGWTDGLETKNPSREEIEFWMRVFDTHRKAVNPGGKPKTQKQIVRWLEDPYSDAAAYRMWGNGVALPCVYYVLSGIVYYAQNQGGLFYIRPACNSGPPE